MKRAAELQALSAEHHRALVLARAARRASEPGDARSVVTAFDQEISQHFETEERGLIPALARAGEHALAARTLDEHRALRSARDALARSEAPHDAHALAELLDAHVRFEERTLFPRAETVLDPATLASLAAAH